MSLDDLQRRADNLGALQFEAVLKGHARASGDGRRLTFLVQTDDVLAADEMQINKRYQIAVVEIGDDERPVKSGKRDKVVTLAAMACIDPPFQGWCIDTYNSGKEPEDREQFAKECIYSYCGVTSRSQLREGTPRGDEFLKMYDEFKGELAVPEDWGDAE